MRRLTSFEVLERQEFVLGKISEGIPRTEIHRLIVDKYELSDRAATNIYNAAVENAPRVTPKEIRFNRQIVLTAYASQVRSAHADMVSLQILIDEANDQNNRRKELIAEFNNTDEDRKEEIINELKLIPPIKLTNISSIIGQKNNVRAQLGKSLSDLARIFGLFADMPLLQAINVMASAELLPPEIANKMLEVIEDISSSIEQSMNEKQPDSNSPINNDFDEEGEMED